MDTNKSDISDLFSRLLIYYKQFDFFRTNGIASEPTDLGHGPFCQLSDGASAYDLRSNNIRSPFGFGHPLALKGLLGERIHSAPNSKSNIFADSQFKYTDIVQDLYSVLLKVKDKFSLSDDQIFLVDPDNFSDELISQINSHQGNCVLIERNLLNYDISGTPVLAKLRVKPKIFMSNYCLPSFVLYSDESMNFSFNLTHSSEIVTNNFLNLLRNSVVLGQNGNISKKNALISDLFSKICNNFRLHGTCLVINQKIATEEALLKKGILCNVQQKKIVFNFPIAMKESQVIHAAGIIKGFL